MTAWLGLTRKMEYGATFPEHIKAPVRNEKFLFTKQETLCKSWFMLTASTRTTELLKTTAGYFI